MNVQLSCVTLLAVLLLFSPLAGGVVPEKHEISLNGESVVVYLIGHGSLAFVYRGTVIHVDPYSGVNDYQSLPKADIILITHHHGDHLDKAAIAAIRDEKSVLLSTEKCKSVLNSGDVLANGDGKTVRGIHIETVPAYNPEGKYHLKGECNGYILNFGKMRVYVAGDTGLIEEMKGLGALDIAFLPVNKPYTMSAEEAAAAARVLKPKILFACHFFHGETDVERLPELLKDEKELDVRVPFRLQMGNGGKNE